MVDPREEELAAFTRELYARKPEKVVYRRPKPEAPQGFARGLKLVGGILTLAAGLIRLAATLVHHHPG